MLSYRGASTVRIIFVLRCIDIHSSGETTDIILKSLLTIMSCSSTGRQALVATEDWSPLIEIAPKQPLVLSILAWAWTSSQNTDGTTMTKRVDDAILALCASYRGTDAVTLLDFLSSLLSRLNSDVSPPPWSSVRS